MPVGRPPHIARQSIKIRLLLQLFIVSGLRGYIIDALQPAGAFGRAPPDRVKPWAGDVKKIYRSKIRDV
jgi:hypothetical protein